MFIKQLSVFLENKKGRLASLASVMARNGIDLYALSIADTTNFGILRALTNDTDKAARILREEGFMVNTTEVIAAEVDDRPGGLAKVLDVLDAGGIGVEYLYSFVRNPSDSALILFRVSDTEAAFKVLTEAGVRLIGLDELSKK